MSTTAYPHYPAITQQTTPPGIGLLKLCLLCAVVPLVFLILPAESPQEEGKPKRKLNFRRLLLNKCQEEFEKGNAAMTAVAVREAKKAQGGEEEKEVRAAARPGPHGSWSCWFWQCCRALHLPAVTGGDPSCMPAHSVLLLQLHLGPHHSQETFAWFIMTAVYVRLSADRLQLVCCSTVVVLSHGLCCCLLHCCRMRMTRMRTKPRSLQQQTRKRQKQQRARSRVWRRERFRQRQSRWGCAFSLDILSEIMAGHSSAGQQVPASLLLKRLLMLLHSYSYLGVSSWWSLCSAGVVVCHGNFTTCRAK